MTRARTRVPFVVLLCSSGLAVAVPGASAPRPEKPLAVVEMAEEGMALALVDGRRIEGRAMPRAGEGWSELAARLLGQARRSGELRKANGGGNPREGAAVIVPWMLLSLQVKQKALAAFFPEDRATAEGVTHKVRFRTQGSRGETPAAIAEWYAGSSGAAGKLRLPQGRKASLLPGDLVTVPAAVLSAEWRRTLPAPAAPKAAPAKEAEKKKGASAGRREPKETADDEDRDPPPPAEPDLVAEAVPVGEPAVSETGEVGGEGEAEPERGESSEEIAQETPFALEDDATSGRAFAFANGGPLEYRKDDRGPYAAYYLRPGEALYSSVVGRFTGRVDADEVNTLAELVAVRSDIDDVTDIPIGFRIKIPLELLLPEWLPPGHPERVAYETTKRETAKVKSPPETKELAGVVIILDSGHGGEDVGAMANGAWESDYVYDIVSRVKRILAGETAAQVIATMKDREHGFAVFDAKELPRNKAEEIQTSPPYRPVLGQPGVHFRWYLSNYYYRQLTRKGQRPEHVVFTSFHADSLHPSMRGAMVYVPGRRYRTLKFSSARGIYGGRKEVKAVPVVSFTEKDLVRSEGLSRQLASHVLTAFADEGLAVHPSSAVRDHVVRKGRSWTPAVIKYAQVPTSILLEVCNLNNTADARNIRDPVFRESVARAYVNALRAYYGESKRPKTVKASRDR